MDSVSPAKKANCHCGWDDCLDLCSIIAPLDEEVLKRPRMKVQDSTHDDDIDVDALRKAMVSDEEMLIKPSKNGPDDVKIIVEKKRDACEEKKPKAAAKTPSDESDEPSTQEPVVTRKRNKEKKRRGDITKGLEKLAHVVFTIDPELKDRALKDHGGLKSTVKDIQLLERVDLVKAAVATLARVHQDNEVHKLITAHLTSGGDNDSLPELPPDSFLSPNIVVPPFPQPQDEGQHVEDPTVPRAEIKRQREKKRRADTAKAFDMLSEVVLAIDANVKAAAEERAKKIRSGGSTSSSNTTKQLLSRVELVNCAVAIMSRIYKENEIHKMVIASLAARSVGGSAESSESPSSEDFLPRSVSPTSPHGPSVVAPSHAIPGDEGMMDTADSFSRVFDDDESPDVPRVAYNSVTEAFSLRECFELDREVPAAKRFKAYH